jgi:hypothetical protein
MSDTSCGYVGNRDEALVAYLYDDIDPAEREAFDAHLGVCARCRVDLDALRGVRGELGRWEAPVPALVASRAPDVPRAWWRQVPAWARVAAALLVLGASAAVANLDVRYDRTGLTIRTGWSHRAAVAPAAVSAPAMADAPWRADLAAFEQRLRTEFHAESVGAAMAPAVARPASSADAADAALLRRVRALIDDSERRQQRELALRIAQVVRDVDAQRQADLVRIDRSLGEMQSNTGVEVLRQRELLNYLVRVSQKQ